ncbi:MAG: DNA cytosine methyltransferase [Saprospiraceae bacterium]
MLTNNRPKAISLFAGAGGCSLGFQQAGYDVIFANDINKPAIETYKKNAPHTTTSTQDICSIDFPKLLNDLGVRKGEIDIVIGGPPCQGFSTAGARFWDDPRNHLLKLYIRALELVRPKWFLMENVEGLLTSNNGLYIFETVKALLGLGYSVRLEKVYSQEYGIPQRRKRVIILGNRLGIEFEFPKPTTFAYGKIFNKSEVTLNHALMGLPNPTRENCVLKYEVDFSDTWASCLINDQGLVTDHFAPSLEAVHLARIQKLKPGQTMKDLPEHLQHPSFKKRALRRVMDGMPSEKRGGAPSGLKRLKSDEPSLTITGSATRELIHPVEDRYLTIRECARIQTFPDSFLFCGSASDKIQQIGNAIPPLLAYVFAKHLLNIGVCQHQAADKGKLLGFALSKSEGLSPSLQKTGRLLAGLNPTDIRQLSMF